MPPMPHDCSISSPRSRFRSMTRPTRPTFVTVTANDDPHAGVTTVTAAAEAATAPISAPSPISARAENGVRFSDVAPGSPAAKAGLKGGDVLVRFGDKPIMNLYDFTDALRASKVGEMVEVTVMRDGKPLKVSVKLEQRR